jgi:hypothetical protein
MTIVEPGGARTEFRYGSAQVAELMPVYDDTPAHSFLKMLDPANDLAPVDPPRMAARIIDSVDVEPALLRMMLGSQAPESTCATLRARIADFEAQRELAASTDFPPASEEAHAVPLPTRRGWAPVRHPRGGMSGVSRVGCAGAEDAETPTAGTALSLLLASETGSSWKSRRLVIHRTAPPIAANH